MVMAMTVVEAILYVMMVNRVYEADNGVGNVA
jgi:hypothetical protein